MACCHPLGAAQAWRGLWAGSPLHSCQIRSLPVLHSSPHPQTQIPLGLLEQTRTRKSFQSLLSLRWQVGVLSESGGLLLEQQSQLDQRKKALGAKLLRPSHFLLSFPPLSLCTNLGKLQKRPGRCDLSPVGGVGGEDGKLGFLADWIWGLLRMECTETLGPGAGQGRAGGADGRDEAGEAEGLSLCLRGSVTIKSLWLFLGTSASAAGSQPVELPFCRLNSDSRGCLLGRGSGPHTLPSLLRCTRTPHQYLPPHQPPTPDTHTHTEPDS